MQPSVENKARSRRAPRLALALVSCAAVSLDSGPLWAEPADETGDALGYFVHVDAAGRLFRRDTYPDPAGGALVAGGVAAPLYHYALMRVDDVDVPWGDDSLDVELSAWGNLELAEADGTGRVDGDVQVAKVRQRFRYGQVALGRQVQAGGAARFVRFDGASAGARVPLDPVDVGLDAYGGFTVLPRWSGWPGYHLLGSAADTLLRNPEAFEDLAREQHWLAGGRVYVDRPGLVTAAASFHEQAEQGGLGRRNGALDLNVTPIEQLSWSGRAIVDLDTIGLADLRVSLDAYPLRDLTLGATYQHLTPALMLSRQSVLSVFSTDAFDEWGTQADVRPLRWLRLTGEGFVQRFEGGDLGARGGGRVRFIDSGRIPSSVALGYRRVVEPENGYHALRASLSARPVAPLLLAGDGFLYLYDEPIEGLSTSVVGMLSAGWRASGHVETTLSMSLARSPYARLDAQALARVSVSFEGGGR